MANADFEPKKAASGGFDASSYRTVEQDAPSRSLTPFEKKLAGLEKALGRLEGLAVVGPAAGGERIHRRLELGHRGDELSFSSGVGGKAHDGHAAA